IAGHLPDGVQILGQHHRAAAQSRRGHRRLDPGVSSADDEDLVAFWVDKHLHNLSPVWSKINFLGLLNGWRCAQCRLTQYGGLGSRPAAVISLRIATQSRAPGSCGLFFAIASERLFHVEQSSTLPCSTTKVSFSSCP